ncbi:MAG: hypothetical protein U5J98_10730 [Halobacteriales archaeon]|nr:hypothetical protein [Halobacteriales archaeon]
MVRLPAAACEQYVALSRFNSPYPAHDAGRAVDLYPGDGAPSPVAGEVVEHRRVACPSRPYAESHDHLLVIDTGEHLARLLHVEPSVAVGDTVALGDELGRTVRSGYFAPWVDDHLHLGFRPRDGDAVRASGSLPLELGVDVEPLAWDGTGTVVETGETHVVLDAPTHPAPGEAFVGIAARVDGRDVALDGGLPHYAGAGLLGGGDGPVALLGTTVGTARGGLVTWGDVEVRADGRPVHGLSLGAFREPRGAKLVDWDGPPATVGETVEVTIVPA